MKNILLTVFIASLFLTVGCLKEDDDIIEIAPIQGVVFAPEVGGAAQPNQVWVNLSDNTQKLNHRTEWDLGFYSGDEFRVILNNSILMAAAQINSDNIDAVNSSNFTGLISIIDPTAGFPEDYIDDVTGNYLNDGTVIEAISTNDADNKVYLLKLGYDVYQNNDIPNNSTYVAGDFRGYLKIRILRHGSDAYKLQYAELNDTTHQEVIITKNPDYLFTFFSFETEEEVIIQPKKNEWDLCFTVWNNVIPGHGTYIYADFVVTNMMAGVGAYQIITTSNTLDEDFNQFKIEDVDFSLFDYSDQRVIGSNWRETVSGTSSTPVVSGDRFYVIKDAEGQLFKLRFLSMLSQNSERGHPVFEYVQL